MEVIRVYSISDLREILLCYSLKNWNTPVILVLNASYWRDRDSKNRPTPNFTITLSPELIVGEISFYLKSKFVKETIENPDKIEEHIRKLLEKEFFDLTCAAKEIKVPVVYSIKNARTDF